MSLSLVRRTLLASLLASAALPAGAHADDDEAEAAEAPRDPAYYRGRSVPTPPEEVLAWVPRVLFAPVTFVTEFVLRRPLIALIDFLEEEHVIATVQDILQPHPNVSWSPTLSLEADVFVLPGAFLEWRNALVPGHTFRAAGEFAATDFWSAEVRDSWRAGPVELGVRGGHNTRPERPFFGLGPSSPSVRRFYSLSRLELLGFVAVEHRLHARVELSGGYTLDRTGPGIDPSIEAMPNVVLGLYELAIGRLSLVLDSRESRGTNGGVRLAANGAFAFDARDERRSFGTAEGELEGAIEVAAPDRVLAARAYYAVAIPADDAAVPLHYLPTLGLMNHRGFSAGRFRGESALLLEVRYRYPIAFYVDLQWIASVGNVFERDLSDFELGALTASFGVGVRTRRILGDPIEVGFALGTTRFDSDGFGIDGARVFLSTTQGL